MNFLKKPDLVSYATPCNVKSYKQFYCSISKYSIVKKYFSLAVAGVALLLCSCQKEDLADTIPNSTLSAINASDARINTTAVTNYGAEIDPPKGQTNPVDFQVKIAGQLGISYFRGCTLVPATWSSADLLNNGTYKVVLNFNTARGSNPIPYVKDLTKYKTNLNNILNTYTTLPVMAVIENEESNKLFYSGTPLEYINQLKTAIGVMHNRGIKVADGGLGGPGLSLLVYQDFLNQGKKDSAQLFMNLTHLTPDAITIQERANFIDVLLQSFTVMDLDYINFHWKAESPNADAFAEVIAYLRKRTGKPVINNELGQFDKDPNTLNAHLQKAANGNLAYALWYSPDENAGQKATSLHHPNSSLTSSGTAYKNFPKN